MARKRRIHLILLSVRLITFMGKTRKECNNNNNNNSPTKLDTTLSKNVQNIT